MVEIKLHDDFILSGCSIEGFFDAITAMDACTEVQTVSSEYLGFVAIADSYDDACDIALSASPWNSHTTYSEILDENYKFITSTVDKGLLPILFVTPENKFVFKTMNKANMKKRGVPDELMNDLCVDSKLMIRYDDTNYIVSPIAFTTLLSRAGLGGDSMNKPCISRAIDIARQLYFHRQQEIKFVARKNATAQIIVGAHSAKYCYVPQSILREIYDLITTDFGKTDCVNWTVTHRMSNCYVGFPDVAEDFSKTYGLPDTVLPGLYFGTSDSGDSSLVIRGFWQIAGHVVGGESIKRNHRGEIDTGEFVKKAGAEIFATYATVPERLAELLTIDCPNPPQTIKRVLKQAKAVAAGGVGRKKMDEVYRELCAEFPIGGKYTAYDIATSIASLPKRVIGASPSVVEKLEVIAKNAIFADYTEPKSEPELVLGA